MARVTTPAPELRDDTVGVSGELTVTPGRTGMELKARVEPVDAGYQIEPEVFIMQRGLGITWSRRR
jgi:hypothetical protein